ncbi:phosphotransferase family protein [Haloarchaeobius sp. DFWS5]|uniref:phosphotransferase family protein n=1 Tax=Haloarchaeobius sp. DFWS5 TaxID=3446114 RepID=UPI003EB9290C
MDERLRSALHDAFPDRTVDSTGASGPSWNEQNETVGVEFEDGDRIYLKVALDGDGSRIARESAVLAFVRANSSVPVPTIAACDPSASVPYLATEEVEGRLLHRDWGEADQPARAAMAREVGTALATVHELRFDAHGHVVGGGASGIDLDTKSWTDVLVDTIGEMQTRAPSDRFDHHFDEVAAAIETNRDLLDDTPAVLLHGDPAMPNCFQTDAGVGFLDWEISHVGDPARDVYRTQDQQFTESSTDDPERMTTAFYDGYRARAGGLPDGYEARTPIYDAVRLLAYSGHFENYVEYLDESREELADWVTAEMARRLDRIR